MKCFSFFKGAKKDERKARKPISVQSMNSTIIERKMRIFRTDLNTQNVPDNSTESLGRTSFPILSHRHNLRVFTMSELKSATKNFCSSVIIGHGGFGRVYKGLIENGEDPTTKIEVAVKQLDFGRQIQGHKEWMAEVNVLGLVEHPNLIKLVGYCAEDDERGIQRLLVYEFMPNGSVEHHLSTRSETPLPWAMRLKIAQDAAHGLKYLHEEMDFQIIFRDFKPSNILLDEQWNAKLSDFGLARLGPAEGSTHVTCSEVVGTIGYAAPEYIQTGRATSKIDVWGYGVFLLQLITGRRPLDRSLPENEQKLLEWVKPFLADAKKLVLMVDPRLKKEYSLTSAQKLALVAKQCLVKEAKDRPNMSEVLEMINRIVEASTETESLATFVQANSKPAHRSISHGDFTDESSTLSLTLRLY
ncbi:hypothetical protein CJ030_MR2G011685 [Morella rubra]|uniref:non-specific serine/threonine protein kinase n=1 Tax=Morella rubra TaxID=262757 RepID=A0A6A1WEI0_9ROSI|nr:hypothetical protein CJ030_MR2G011685 [Morella rubra]